jgi:hypothetical protein
MPCAGKDCTEFGWYDQRADCREDFQCPSETCGYKWRNAEQPPAKQSLIGRLNWNIGLVLRVHEWKVSSNIYKLISGSTCPRCRCFIQHDGGCPNMKCTMCDFEFCWWCKDEFNTLFHMQDPIESTCPFRKNLLNGFFIFIGFLLYLKLHESFGFI